MNLNYDKKTSGRKSTGQMTFVPERLRVMTWPQLRAEALQHGGAAIVESADRTMIAPSCTECARKAVEARLRVWLARKERAES